ncbi:MAG TPA: hypothetical protein PLP57_09785 [Candidatus Saccharicenans sp.]|nr:hypothetical protein [Candidatus Saccharicenans sp.]HRD02910.1 hypothetical protein [Candidatus Saccharicenans sp.]
MKNNALKKLMVITLIVAAVYSLLPALAQAAAPAKDKCFAEFDRCTREDVRTKFPWSSIDYLDCEVALASCLVHQFT